MGNQLAGIAPSQILSVDSYFSDIPEYEYDRSLGSTRFFKVARAKHREASWWSRCSPSRCEKRWLAFPDLGAVEAEPPPARHGDIKSGGTSWDFVWNWDSRIRQLQTHDFWPEDIPQNFKLTSSTTSRRPLLHRPREVGLGTSCSPSRRTQPAMDIFSAGYKH
uniref:Uncharacterized protein n=1 Tax=Neogobius melanostomus TaxID=47308 RepID=A0A8C6TJ50_9GOBI